MTIRFLFLIAIILTGAIAQENKKFVFLDDTVVIEPGQIKYFSFQSVNMRRRVERLESRA